MTTRTHFTFRLDRLDANGEVFEHVAGIEDFELAEATYQAALKRWPGDPIMLRQGARVVHDSRKTRLAWDLGNSDVAGHKFSSCVPG